MLCNTIICRLAIVMLSLSAGVGGAQSIRLDSLASEDHLRHSCFSDSEKVTAYCTVTGSFSTANFFHVILRYASYRDFDLAMDQTTALKKLSFRFWSGQFPTPDGEVRITSTDPPLVSNATAVNIDQPEIEWPHNPPFVKQIDSAFRLTPYVYPPGSRFHWEFGPDASPASSDSSDPEVRYHTAGVKRVSVTMSCECGSVTDTITVIVKPLSEVETSPVGLPRDILLRITSTGVIVRAARPLKSLRIVNAMGSTVLSLDARGVTTFSIDMTSLPSGLYFLTDATGVLDKFIW